MQWRSVGPARGGRSIAAGGSDARPNEYWFGATGGGAWKTTDGGTTWAPMTDGKIAHVVGRRARRLPGQPRRRLHRRRGSRLPRQHHPGRRRLPDRRRRHDLDARSACATRRRSRGCASHPTSCDTVYAAVFGPPYNEHAERGVFKSTDGGQTWRKTLFRDGKTGAVDLTLDPKNPQVLFASLWEAFRTPWSMSSGGPGSGLFKSSDGGDTWTELTKNPGLPAGLWGKVGVVGLAGRRQPASTRSIENEAAGGLYVSDDAGATWRQTSDNRNIRQRAFYYSRLLADTKDKDTVYVLNVQFYKSTDAGKTLDHDPRAARRQPRPVDLADRQPAHGAGQRRRRQRLGQRRPHAGPARTIPTGQFYNVFTTKHVPYHICGAQQDNSTACVGSQAQAGAGEGSLPPIFYAVGGGESGYIAPDPTDTERVLRRQLRRVPEPAGSRDRSAARGQHLPEQPDGLLGHRHQGTLPVDVPDRVLAARPEGALRLVAAPVAHRPTAARAGRRSARTSRAPIPRRCRPRAARSRSDQTGVETYAVIFTIAPSRQDAQHHLDRLGRRLGARHPRRRQDVDQGHAAAILPEFTRIGLIEASPHQNGVAYLAGNRYQLGDRRPYLYKTADFGQSWTKIVTGIPDDDFLRVVREDPEAPRAALRRHRARHLRVVRRRRRVAAAAAQPARHAGARHRGRGARPGHRHARPRLLRARQHRRAAAGHARAHDQRPVRLPDLRSAARPRPQRDDRLLPGPRRRRGEDRVPRRRRPGAAHVHRHAQGRSERRTAAGRRSRGGGVLRPGAGPRRRRQGHEPLHLGHALRRGDGVPRHDHVGRPAAARAGGAARRLHRAHHGQRPDAHPRLPDRPRPAPRRPTASRSRTCASSSRCRRAFATRSARPTRPSSPSGRFATR